MRYELKDPSKAKELFAGWNETLIFSCLQNIMGKIYVTEPERPKSALAFVGCFGFYAGTPDRQLVMDKPDGFAIMIPQNKGWAMLIEECYPSAGKVTRYAIKKDTVFDRSMLRGEMEKLPAGYELKRIDADIYDQLNCLAEGLYPSWDAQNMNSVHLAEKLGYELDHAYTAYEVV